MDEMRMYEISPLVSNIHRKHKESWEQTRFLSYIIAQVNSTKKMKPTDVMSFPWDEKDNTEEDKTISNDDIDRLRKKAKKYLNKK